MGYLIEQARIDKEIEEYGPCTFFCPKDEHFPRDLYMKILDNDTLREEVARYHIIRGMYTSDNLTNDRTIMTFDNKNSIRSNVYKIGNETTVTINGAKLQIVDIEETRKPGVVHITNGLFYPVPTESILDKISEDSKLSTLLYAIAKANIQNDLQDGPLTLFAPTNEAFDKLPPGVYNSLLANQSALVDVLTTHVVKHTMYSVSFRYGASLTALNNQVLKISSPHKKHGTISVNNANITKSDISVTNGVIHVINEVLVPWK